MPVFHVYLNGKRLSSAGVGELGVLGAHVSWVHRKGGSSRVKSRGALKEEMTLQLAGYRAASGEHLHWLDRRLKVGDDIRVVIAGDGSIDRPRSREQRDRAKELRAQKQYVREMARQFGWKVQTQ